MSYRPICDVWLLARGAGSSGKKAFYGAYPSGFLRRAIDLVGSGKVCHLCSGSLENEPYTVDINPDCHPSFVEDARHTSFESGVFDSVLIDPPYSEEDAKRYGTGLPSMKDLLVEACRIVKPGGKVGLLHLLVPHIPKGFEQREVALIAVVCGCNQRIRVFTVLKRLTDD